jgi:tetratricopeptide (TPR) repeat protein
MIKIKRKKRQISRTAKISLHAGHFTLQQQSAELCNMGLAFQKRGQIDEAVSRYMKSIELNSDNADPYINLGSIFQERGQINEAIKNYEIALKLRPDDAAANYNLGSSFQRIGQLEKAMAFYGKALQINPNPFAYNNLGSILLEKGQVDEGIICFQKALEIDPNYANAHNNLGVAFREKRKTDEAKVCFRKAIRLNPNHADAFNNLGSISNTNRQLDESIKYYQTAIRLDPKHADAHYGLALSLLSLGNFKDGFKEHEWRWKSRDFLKYNCFHRPGDFSQPILSGIDIAGLTVMIYAEQGFGDTVQFIRYAPLVAQRGAKVIIECHKELASLLQTTEGVAQVIVQGEPIPDFDIHCPLLTLPSVFDTSVENIPARIPYISVNSMLVQKWRDKMRHDKSKLKVGLVWHGNPKHKNDRNRSIPFTCFSHLAKFTDITFYSLQKGEASEQTKNLPAGMRLRDLTEEIDDFSDTAALIENLDLTISVDTSVAHLAGALGRPVWTLIPSDPDWRWMLNREDTPWYPAMRLFRQLSPGDWASVIAKVKDELLKLPDSAHITS